MPIKELVIRNKIIVALYICGFSQREIADFVKADRRNVQMFLRKYKPRYGEEIINKIVKNLSGSMLGGKPTKLKKGEE